MSARTDWSVGVDAAADWELLCEHPLAYQRELAYAHHEALREGADVDVIEMPAVIDLDSYRSLRRDENE